MQVADTQISVLRGQGGSCLGGKEPPQTPETWLGPWSSRPQSGQAEGHQVLPVTEASPEPRAASGHAGQREALDAASRASSAAAPGP